MTNIELLLLKILFVYLLCINLLAVILTLRDKKLAKNGRWRIPEKHLLLVGALGGALGEWIVMLLIRHKTKHPKFMITLPLFFTVHVIILGALAIHYFS